MTEFLAAVTFGINALINYNKAGIWFSQTNLTAKEEEPQTDFLHLKQQLMIIKGKPETPDELQVSKPGN